MARGHGASRCQSVSSLEIDENASDESDFFLVRQTCGRLSPPLLTASSSEVDPLPRGAGSPPLPPPPLRPLQLPPPADQLPAARSVSLTFANSVNSSLLLVNSSPLLGNSSPLLVNSSPPLVNVNRKRKIDKEEKECAERDGRKTRTDHQHATVESADAAGVTMVFGKQYLRNADDVRALPDGDKMLHWHPSVATDVDQGLAADFDDSLTGLGVNISSTTYNMSEALLALPSISNMSAILKNEAVSLHSDSCNTAAAEHSAGGGSAPASIHHQDVSAGPSLDHQGPASVAAADGRRGTAAVVITEHLRHTSQRFQYVLNAATSIATKVSEESLTYLNQGQSYEIRVKKLGDLSSCSDAVYRTKLKLCFHERRLQYIEKEQLDAWRNARPGDRLLEVDVPLSYGIFDVRQDPDLLNCCEFLWNPSKDVGVYVKVHSVSTEFTPKKHGGEKGVPFRLQAETYSAVESGGPLLHCAASQIKVFKLKGADRKHKQDRDRIMKRSPSELDKYQPSFDCTVLTEAPLDLVQPAPVESPCVPPLPPPPPPPPPPLPPPSMPITGGDGSSPPGSTTDRHLRQQNVNGGGSQTNSSPTDSIAEDEAMPVDVHLSHLPSSSPHHHPPQPPPQQLQHPQQQLLSVYAGPTETYEWLVRSRFGAYAGQLCNFTGADLMRMSRDDVVQICGLADGVRLYNCLHNKLILPQLTVYVATAGCSLYHALYLYQTTRTEMVRKLSALLGCAVSGPGAISQVCVEGPSGVSVLVTDEVVRHLHNESLYNVDTVAGSSCDKISVVLRRATPLSAQSVVTQLNRNS